MRIIQEDGKKKLVMSRAEWIDLGKQTRWLRRAKMENYWTPETTQEIHEVTVEKYGDYWAVYVDGLLLCVTVYKRAAFSVKSLVEELTDKIRRLERQPTRQLERPEIAQQDAKERREAV